jgi:hypothetical protein
MKTLNYRITVGITGINIITVYEGDILLCELSTLIDSRKHPVEEIEDWLYANNYDSSEYAFNRIRK